MEAAPLIHRNVAIQSTEVRYTFVFLRLSNTDIHHIFKFDSLKVRNTFISPS